MRAPQASDAGEGSPEAVDAATACPGASLPRPADLTHLAPPPDAPASPEGSARAAASVATSLAESLSSQVRPLAVAMGQALATGRPEVLAILATPDAVRLERREILAAELARDGLRGLAKVVRRRRLAPGDLLLVLVAEGAPEVRVLSLDAPNRKEPR